MPNPKPFFFDGFEDEDLSFIRLPESFFTNLLPVLNEMTHIQLLLYLFWHQEKQECPIRYFTLSELASDPTLIQMLGDKHVLETALESLVSLGILLKAQNPDANEPLFFLNSQQGRAALEALEKEQWQTPSNGTKQIHLIPDQPNIFKLYEQNIGAITPMMAEILKEDETRYPSEWIAEAIRIAVTRNIRNWKYIQAILQRWQKEGRGHEQNRRDDSQDPDSYRESWLRHG